MFGMGITEILFIAIIAIIFLGPEHLPKAMVEVAKLIKSVKKVVTDTKETIEKEVNITELKNEALDYKKMVEDGVGEFSKVGDMNLDSILEDKPKKDTHTPNEEKKVESKNEEPKKEIPKIKESE
ncbi:MAG: Sec-independent protein translocase protein TatB [Campylobacterales bacterium]